jgi:hypothetical protein
MHCLPFKDRSRAIRPKENGGEYLHTHHGSQCAQSLWRTRGRGTKDHHESHGKANNASRIDSDRSGKVLSSNRRPAIGGNDAQHADSDSKEGDEQHGNSHVFSTPIARRFPQSTRRETRCPLPLLASRGASDARGRSCNT